MENSLTFDSVSLTHRLYSCTKRLNQTDDDDNNFIEIVTNLDFMKWKSCMRKEETFTIFSDYDDLFGICNVFARSHEVFNTCTFYLADGSLTS